MWVAVMAPAAAAAARRSWAELREIPLNLLVSFLLAAIAPAGSNPAVLVLELSSAPPLLLLLLAAIAPAGSNPAVLVLELRFEALRTALNDYSRMITDDFRTDVTAAKLAEMGMGK